VKETPFLLLADIIICILVMPGMMFLFPTGEWLLWHPGHVVTYALWLYGVWLLCRRQLGPMLARDRGWRSLATVGGTLFLIAIVTFLMSLTPVDFPRSTEGIGQMELHVRAMWILLLAVVSYALPVGVLAAKIRTLQDAVDTRQAASQAFSALESRRQEAVPTGEEVRVKVDYQTVHVPLSAIQYIEGRNNYACFHLDFREDVVPQMTLREVEALLPEGKFVRIHRSYIVPVWRIDKRNATQVVLLGVDTPLPVGRAHKDNLKKNG